MCLGPSRDPEREYGTREANWPHTWGQEKEAIMKTHIGDGKQTIPEFLVGKNLLLLFQQGSRKGSPLVPTAGKATSVRIMNMVSLGRDPSPHYTSIQSGTTPVTTLSKPVSLSLAWAHSPCFWTYTLWPEDSVPNLDQTMSLSCSQLLEIRKSCQLNWQGNPRSQRPLWDLFHCPRLQRGSLGI